MLNKFINSQNGKMISKLMAVMIVITLTFTNFIFLFSSMYKGIISYAQEIDLNKQNNRTNNDNVTFDVYLSNANKSVNTITSDINSQDLKLYIAINVQNGGYLQETEVEFIDTNFRIKDNEDVTKFSLKPIQSGSTITEEIPIVALKEDVFNISLLNKVSQIKLTGTYINNEGENVAIDTTKGFQISWTAENITVENNPVELFEKIITNKIYNINGENKRVVQTLVTSGILNNTYPISKTNIELNVPKLLEEEIYPEEVLVSSNGTGATNGKSSINFETDNWEYNEEKHKIYINTQNQVDENNNIIWNKKGQDTFVVTYIYDEMVDVSQLSLETNSEITLYDSTNKILTKELIQTLENSEEKTGIFSLEVMPNNVIYKGNMKLGLETEFETMWKAGINYTGLASALQISNSADLLNIEVPEVSYYKTTFINKEEFVKILGEQGNISVYNGENLIQQITYQTETNESGDLEVNYPEEIEEIKILTTVPVNAGILNIKHIKVLKSQADCTEINLLTTNAKLESNERVTATGEMTILNTEAEIELGIESNRLSTTQENELNITTTLKINDIKYSLYENPVIEIVLPQEINTIELDDSDIQILNGNGLEFMSKAITENNGYKILTIQLTGKQEAYNQLNTQIAVSMKVCVNELTPTIEKSVYARVTNLEEVVTDDKSLEFLAEEGLLLATTALNYNGEGSEVTSFKNNARTGELAAGIKSYACVTIKGTIVNNNDEVANPIIIGRIFNKDSKINATLSEPMKKDNAKIYYTEDEEVKQESNWSETYTQNATGYKIEFNESLETKATDTFEYDVVLPSNLKNNASISFSYDVYNGIDKTSATAVTLATPQVVKLELNVEPSVANGETVYTGQELTYIIKVKNIGDVDAKNVVINNPTPEGTTLVSREEISKDSIEVGETLTETVTIRVNNAVTLTQITNIVQVEANNLNEMLITTITNNIEQALVKITMKDAFEDGQLNYEKGQLGFNVEIENIANTTLSNVKLTTKIPEGTTYLEDSALIVLMEEMEEGEREIFGGEVVQKNIIVDKKDNEIEYTVEQLNSKETIKASLILTANEFNEEDGYEKNIVYEAEVKINDIKTYNMKKLDKIIKPNLFLTQTSVNQTETSRNEYVNAGDILKYTTTFVNNGDYEQQIVLKGQIPDSLELISMGYNTSEEIGELNDTNYEIELTLLPKDRLILNMEAKVKDITTEEDYIINNTVEGCAKIFVRQGPTEEIFTNVKSKSIQYKIKGTNVEQPTNPEEPENPTEPVIKNYKISGLAWLDQNQDGKIDESEEKIKDIVVKIKDATTNEYVQKDGEALQTSTNELGEYEFTNLSIGKYVIIFEYNTKTYSLTKSSSNSVAAITTTSEGNVVRTNTIEIKEANINNVNIGLVLNPEFDLQLDKYISKVTVQNNTGSTDYNYKNTGLAKIEIPAKNIKGSTIIVEYTIKVTNNGAVPGYAKNIVDYLSEELTFNSELNTNWYQDKDNNLYSVELANTEIQPEESKEIKLVLTKTMQDDATVLINNTAEIYEDYNEYALEDINSIPANTDEKENDMSPADILITIKTGGPVLYIGIVIVSMIILGGGIYLINKKVLQKRFI